MFTGIVEATGTVSKMTHQENLIQLELESDLDMNSIRIGDSIAVNGICLTATAKKGQRVYVDVMAETLKHTSLKHMEEGTRVNLELAMQAGGRFGGHFVQGHVDATGTIASIEEEENMIYVHVQTPKEQLRYMTNKGSVTVDGISLTIFGVDDEKETFTLSIIPHTWQVTNLSAKQAGDLVNIECDMLAKYTERLLTAEK
ncbi:hypothetical protein CHL76_06060 [Marinococcus halophilus]|uniref:Riboflavin synthase n=1 Tax=Marinococcus halophilus TaxID=1371 RepID=A0A510Y3P7_MARHA|nr:riboflavin synthase [Marinococcus halophilus]OZT80892.1 hypothetical protein CHL76_06060 [Marinococcus halophilus]GEK57948.1 riboflavin synthase subunit alpha [Marinococcus halophilus]